VLLEDVPGTAKTILARAIAQSIGEQPSRGSNVRLTFSRRTSQGSRSSTSGRASSSSDPAPCSPTSCSSTRPTGDAAHAVSAARGDGRRSGHSRRVTRQLPSPFLVIASENPIDQEALSRCPRRNWIALRCACAWDTRVRTRRSRSSSLSVTASDRPHRAGRERRRVAALQRAVEDVYVDELMLRWTVQLVRATREVEGVAIGASVRGSLTLERSARPWPSWMAATTPFRGHRAAVPAGARPSPAADRLLPCGDARARPRRGARADPQRCLELARRRPRLDP